MAVLRISPTQGRVVICLFYKFDCFCFYFPFNFKFNFRDYWVSQCMHFLPYLKIVRTPLNVLLRGFLKLSFSLSMHLFPRMNVMLDFIWTLPVQLRGTMNKWTIEKNLAHARIRTTNHRTASRLQVHRYHHWATIHLIWNGIKCPWNYILIQTVRFRVLIISIPDEELFSETTVGCIASYLVQIIWFEVVYCFICGRRRVAVARYRIVFFLFRNPQSWTCSIQMKSSMTFVQDISAQRERKIILKAAK